MQKHSHVPQYPSLSTFTRVCLLVVMLAGLMAVAPGAQVIAGPPEPEPYLVADIYTGLGGSDPYYLTAVGGRLFFVAYDEAHGDELWRSDGLGGSTELVKDIYPGKFNSHPVSLTDVDGTLFFVANDGIHGEELWRSDGTSAGTVLVKDIYTGSGGSLFYYGMDWVAANGTLFFVANDGIHGEELWRSDGTEAGTVLVKDIRPGIEGSIDVNYRSMVADGGALFFIADDGIHGEELWWSDGTEAGTLLVKDIYPGPNQSIFLPYLELVNIDGTIFFIADDGTCGNELWRSDGTEAGTGLVKNIYPDGNHSYPVNLTAVNGKLFFSANDGTNGEELWQSDGSEAGTGLVKNIFPGAGGSVSGYSDLDWIAVNDTLFFVANDGTHGLELWRSDGSEAGTTMVKDIHPGVGGSIPWDLVYVNGRIYFSAHNDPFGEELWQSDGTKEGTRLVKDIYPGSTSSHPQYLTNVGGKLFFTACNFDYYYYFLSLQKGIPIDEPFGIELWSLGYFIHMPVLSK
jgi:ELWxxDGT repeat protein